MKRLKYLLEQLKRKAKSRSAFTLAETLVAILIMLMVSSVVATGIPAARRAYESVEMAANSELLLSSTISTLRNELSLAKDIKIEGTDKTSVSYLNPTTGTMSRIYMDKSDVNDKKIMYKMNAAVDGISTGDGEEATRLMSNALTTKVGIEVTFDSITKSGDCIVFHNVIVKSRSDGVERTGRETVSIRIITL